MPNYTKSLLHFDGVDESITFTDESGKTWTVHGNAQIDTAQYKWSASGLFDGTGDWIDTPDSEDWILGNGPFTFDFWMRLSAIDLNQNICGQGSSTTDGTLLSFRIYLGGDNKLYPRIGFPGGGTADINGSTVFVANTWYHIALVRSGDRFTLYVNGNEDGYIDVSPGSSVTDAATVMSIGRLGTIASQYFHGWIDEFRFSNVARWTENFIPPISPYGPLGIHDLELITQIDSVNFFVIDNLEIITEISVPTLTYWYYDQYNVVLLHFDGVDGSPIFLDRSGKPWTAHQDAQLDTSQKVFGTGSGLFDGNSAITTPSSTDFYFDTWYSAGLGIDFWIKFHSLPGLMTGLTICNQQSNIYPQEYWKFKIETTLGGTQYLIFEIQNVDYDFGYVISSHYSFVLNTWYHIAFSAVNGEGKFFIDGINKTLHSFIPQASGTIYIYGADFVVGAAWPNGANGIDAQIDEFSVNRIARYWYDFTLPTGPYGAAGLTIPGISNLEVLINIDSVNFALPPGELKVDGITGWSTVCGISDPSKVSGIGA